MKTKVSIEIEKTEKGYCLSSPEIEGSLIEGNSLDSLIDNFKTTIKDYWNQSSEPPQNTSQSLLELFAEITSDMTESEINALPIDGSHQHDHYIYHTPKRPQ